MRVLLVEDEPALRRLLMRSLGEEGFRVDLADNGEDGLHLAQTQDYDAVVLDLMLPRISGGAVLAKLRAGGSTMPVLLLTARDALADKIAGLNAGADDYLTKPFESAELVARLRALIRRDNRLQTSVIEISDLTLDLSARRVTRAGIEIDLRRREYALLEFLALRRGKIVSQGEILAHLCDEDRELTSNVVDVHMSRLRARIERGFATRLIRTVRGLGYILESP